MHAPRQLHLVAVLERTASSAVRLFRKAHQFSVEALRLFQEGRMADAVEPRGVRHLAVLFSVISHSRQHHDVRAAMSDEHRNGESFQDRRSTIISMVLGQGLEANS